MHPLWLVRETRARKDWRQSAYIAPSKPTATDTTVFDCIECGACTAACPSRLDLVNEFRAIKTRMRRERVAMEQAERARQRSAARTERLARAADERDRRRAERMNKPRQW